MEKNYYAVKLIAPRPDFPLTMSESERDVMQRHVIYWQEHMEKGMVHAFGPVMDPKGAYGFGIVSGQNEEQIKEFVNNDPALEVITAEYYPMMAIIAK